MKMKILTLFAISTCVLLGVEGLGGKCTVTEYFWAYQACSSELVQKVWATEMKSSNDSDIMLFKKFFSEQCSNGLMQKTIKCYDQVNKMCQFSIITTDVLQGFADFLCANMDRAAEMYKCPDLKYDSFFQNCFSGRFESSNYQCSVRKVLNKCLKGLSTKCNFNVPDSILQKFEKPCNKPEKCSYATYALSSYMCWRPLYTKLMQHTKSLSILSTKQGLDQFCQYPELNAALGCQKNVDEQCQLSFVDVDALTTGVGNVCKNTEGISKMPLCINKFKMATSGFCLSAAKMSAESPCKYFENFENCAKSIFGACDQQAVSAVLSVTSNLFKPKFCRKADQKSCSDLSYISSLYLCYAPVTIDVMMANLGLAYMSQKKISPAKFCNSKIVSESIKCHKLVDQKCGKSFIKADKIKKLMTDTCKNWRGLKDVQQCYVSGINPLTPRKPCPESNVKTKDISNIDQLCRIVKGYTACEKKRFDKDKCPLSTKKIISSLYDVYSLDRCT